MALTLTEYSFSKRKNSTATPNTAGSDATVTLKHGANIISPVFTMSSASEPVFNYCKFNNRYYFVKSKTNLRNGMWDIECIEDFLGTWKSDIGSTIAVIQYASGGRSDIIDPRIPSETDVVINGSTVEAPWTLTPLNPLLFIGVTGKGSNGIYKMASLSDIRSLLDGVDDWATLFQDLDCLKQLIFGGAASNNLKSVYGIPLDLTVSGISENIVLGSYPCKTSGGTPISGERITTWLYRNNKTVSIPWHYSDWRRSLESIYLYVPCFGLFTLKTSELVNETQLEIYQEVSISNGDTSVQIFAGGRMVATANSNIAVSIGYANTGVDSGKIVSGVVAGAGAVIGGAAAIVTGGASLTAMGAIGGGLAVAAGSIKAAEEGSAFGNASMGGSAITGAEEYIHCWSVAKQLTDSPANLDAVIGKPVFEKHTISTYSGFVQTDGASISGTMLDDEREAINQMLDRGIYYE